MDKYGYFSVKINFILREEKALRYPESSTELGYGMGKGEGWVVSSL